MIKKSKSVRGRKSLQFNLRATSSKTGLTHRFLDLRGLEKLIDFFVAKNNQKLKSDLIVSTSFWHWLYVQSIDSDFETWNLPVYRTVYGGYDPISVAGSLSDGGRFNIGGAQFLEHDLFPNLSKFACLYAAFSVECARAEVGELYGESEEYELLPRKDFHLWNLEKVIKKLNFPGLLDLVDASPMAARWVLQKSPLVSQLLALHLRNAGGDGIIYRSMKLPQENIFAFFVSSDEESKLLFTPKRM